MSVTTGRFEMARSFPVEGDSAYAELHFDGEVWADLHLEGIDLDETSTGRTANARVMVDLYLTRLIGYETWRFEFDEAPARLEVAARRKRWWGFGVAEALREFRQARDWLLENEQGRFPLTETETGELTPAGRAAWKMSERDLAEFLGDLDPEENGVDDPDSSRG
jgi:hypothetical protein